MDVLEKIKQSIIVGHTSADVPYPPELAGQHGVKERVEQALEQDLDPKSIIRDGMLPGMEIVGQKFSSGEYFLPDMLISAQTMKAGMKILEPLMAGQSIEIQGTVVLGTVKGDMHDIGKNLVGVMLEGGGFEVIDLGIDVPFENFAQSAIEHPGAILGLSALLTTTRENMRQTITTLREMGLDNKVIIGGAAVGKAFAEEIAADGFTRNASDVVALVKKLLEIDN